MSSKKVSEKISDAYIYKAELGCEGVYISGPTEDEMFEIDFSSLIDESDAIENVQERNVIIIRSPEKFAERILKICDLRASLERVKMGEDG